MIGIAGMTGAIGGMLIAEAVGYVLQRTGSYSLIFVFAACAYLVALGLIHLIVPELTPVRIEGGVGHQRPGDDRLEFFKIVPMISTIA